MPVEHGQSAGPLGEDAALHAGVKARWNLQVR